MAGEPRAPAALLALLLAIPFAASAQTAYRKEPPNGDLGCRDESIVEQPALETVREGIQRSVCNTARFVDRMFGGEHEYSEMEDDSNGRAGLALGWNELDGFDADARFRASVTLPARN